MKVLSRRECGFVAGGNGPQPLIIGAGALGIAIFLFSIFPI